MPINEVRQTPLGIAKRDVKVAKYTVQEAKTSATEAKNALDAHKQTAQPTLGPQLTTYNITRDKLEWKSTIAEIKSGLSNVEEILAEMKFLFLDLERTIANNDFPILQQVQDCLTSASHAQSAVSDQIDELDNLIQQLYEDDTLDLSNNQPALDLLNQISGLRDRLVASFNALPVAPAPAPAPVAPAPVAPVAPAPAPVAPLPVVPAAAQPAQLNQSPDAVNSVNLLNDISNIGVAFKNQFNGFIDSFKSEAINELKDSVDANLLDHKIAEFTRGMKDEINVIYAELDDKINALKVAANERLDGAKNNDEDDMDEHIKKIINFIKNEFNDYLVGLFKNGCESIEEYKINYFNDLNK